LLTPLAGMAMEIMEEAHAVSIVDWSFKLGWDEFTVHVSGNFTGREGSRGPCAEKEHVAVA
jgi:hypothetical protein